MRAALTGIAAAIAITIVAGVVLSQINPSVQQRYAVDWSTRLDKH
jgi:hypothetical protein